MRMSTLERGCRVRIPQSGRPRMICLIASALLFAAASQIVVAQDQQSLSPAVPAPAAPTQDASTQRPGPPYTQQTPQQLQQLVAPIALYPDSLVAQILAAS